MNKVKKIRINYKCFIIFYYSTESPTFYCSNIDISRKKIKTSKHQDYLKQIILYPLGGFSEGFLISSSPQRGVFEVDVIIEGEVIWVNTVTLFR